MKLDGYILAEGEQPLDVIKDDGGFTSIFRSIAVVGDSLSSGEFEGTNAEGGKTYRDRFEYSWGQFLARMTGSRVYNFSSGGMTAEWYCNSFADEKGYWSADKFCTAYIIALGVNDVFCQHKTVGDVSDVDLSDLKNNKPTFIGYYCRIIQRYKSINADAKFFLVVPPKATFQNKEDEQTLRNAVYAIAGLFENTYVLDLHKYCVTYDDEFRRNFYLGGHLNPMGYALTAKIIGSYIDYIIRLHPRDFAQIGFMGSPDRNTADEFDK